MEALVAVGLASNIVGFLDVASKFCAAINEIYDKGQTFRDQEYTVVTQDLSKVCGDLTHSVTAAPSTGTSASNNQRIISLATRCSVLANVLLAKLQGLVVPPNSGRGTVIRQALKSAWKRDEIQHLVHQLQEYRQELALNVLTELRATCLTQAQLSASLDIALRPLENTISAVETRLSTIVQSLRAELSDITTQLDRLVISQNNIDTSIQSLRQQSTESQEQTATGFQIIASQQERHYEGLSRHLQLQISQLERLRFSTESQSTHVVGDERSLTAFMLSENNTTTTPVYARFMKSAQFAIKDFCAEYQSRSASSGRSIQHAESEALKFVEKSLTDFMECDIANIHSAIFSSNAVSHYAGLGTIMLQVVRREPTPRRQHNNNNTGGQKSLTASLTLITPANVASRGLKFSYDYRIDARGPLSLVTPILLFNILPDGDPLYDLRFELGSRNWRTPPIYDCPNTACDSTLVECLFLHHGRGYSPFDRDSDGDTILHYTAYGTDLDEAYAASEFLIRLGADISTLSRRGLTAFHYALFKLVGRIMLEDLDDALSDFQASKKLLKLLWPDCHESPDMLFVAVLARIYEFPMSKYRSKKPPITLTMDFLSRLKFSEWEGTFVIIWIEYFDALTRDGIPCYDRALLVSFATDFLTFFPPNFEILRSIWHYIRFTVADCATETSGEASSISSIGANGDPAEEDEDSSSITDESSNGDPAEHGSAGLDVFSQGVMELARIYIRCGGKNLYFFKGTETTLLVFICVGFGTQWCTLIEEEAGIPAGEYKNESYRMQQACWRREEELKIRNQEQLRRREEHEKWGEQDKRREMERKRRMEEEVYSTDEDVIQRWAEEDERCVEEDKERRDARQRWACENKRWGEEDIRRKEEEKGWNCVPKNDRY